MKLIVPDSLDEITIDQAIRFFDVQGRVGIPDNVKWIHGVATFSNLSSKEVSGMKVDKIKEVYKIIVDFLNEASEAPLERFWTYGGVEYGLEPDMRGLTAGVFMDLDSLTKDDGWITSLDKIMSILYRPVEIRKGELYQITDYVSEPQWQKDHRAKLMRYNMPYIYVRGLTLFFSKLVKQLSSFSNPEASQQ